MYHKMLDPVYDTGLLCIRQRQNKCIPLYQGLPYHLLSIYAFILCFFLAYIPKYYFVISELRNGLSLYQYWMLLVLGKSYQYICVLPVYILIILVSYIWESILHVLSHYLDLIFLAFLFTKVFHPSFSQCVYQMHSFLLLLRWFSSYYFNFTILLYSCFISLSFLPKQSIRCLFTYRLNKTSVFYIRVLIPTSAFNH